MRQSIRFFFNTIIIVSKYSDLQIAKIKKRLAQHSTLSCNTGLWPLINPVSLYLLYLLPLYLFFKSIFTHFMFWRWACECIDVSEPAHTLVLSPHLLSVASPPAVCTLTVNPGTSPPLIVRLFHLPQMQIPPCHVEIMWPILWEASLLAPYVGVIFYGGYLSHASARCCQCTLYLA